MVKTSNMIEHHRPSSPGTFLLPLCLLFLLQQLLLIHFPLLLVFAATKNEDEEKGGGEEEEEDAKPSKEKGEQEAEGVRVEGGGGKVEVLLPGMQEEGQGVGSAGEGEGG